MIFLFIYVVFCLLIAVLGIHKPLGFWGYLISSLILTPVIGLLLIAAAGENRVRRSDRE
jgi:uncharacterized membrane protein